MLKSLTDTDCKDIHDPNTSSDQTVIHAKLSCQLIALPENE